MRRLLEVLWAGSGVLLAALVLFTFFYRQLEPFLYVCMFLYIIGALRYFLLESLLPNTSTSAQWRIAVTMLVLYIGFPATLILLATAGGNANAVSVLFLDNPHAGASRFWGLLGVLWLILIPVLIAFIPGSLNTKGRKAVADSSVPAWLAGFAGVLTAVFILTMHFGESRPSVLTKAPLGPLTVAAFGAAALFAPLYRAIAKRCIQHGIATVFDPVCWWSAWCVAYGEMRRVSVGIEPDKNDAETAGGEVPDDSGTPKGPTALAARGVAVRIGSGWTDALDRSFVYDTARR